MAPVSWGANKKIILTNREGAFFFVMDCKDMVLNDTGRGKQ